ncbi:MAG: ATP-binding protein [Dehalococcoidia bacterium]|nr:ATP-binding protein [Dehalococcoidia bacterium]
MQDWTLDTYPAASTGKARGHEAALRFVQQVLDGQPSFLLLAGPNGTGKTGLAAGIVHALAEGGKVARFASVVALMSGIRDRFSPDGDYLRNTDGELAKAGAPEYEQWHVDAPVLVLDDLGKVKSSGWVQEKMFLWLDQRLHQNRSTVITLDVPSQEIEAAFGTAVVSRLQQFERVAVQGADLRAGMPS